MPTAIPIRRAAVLGAGVMGAQIAAHLANADLEVSLFELASGGEDPHAGVRAALKRLAKLEPAPLASPERARLIRPATYDHDLESLGAMDLVIEAIAEREDLKTGLYARVAPYLGERAVLASNTSGLGIAGLAATLPEGLRPRFCGIHFFNPPRYMHLVELVADPTTSPAMLDRIETFLVAGLGKGVIRAKDTPNFIANRIGIFSVLATARLAERYGLAPDLVDALTGPAIGRPKSATFRTADVVGLDTLAHVVGTSAGIDGDPWHGLFVLPGWMQALVDAGALGQKTGAGVYRKEGKDIRVLDPGSGEYRPSAPQVDDAVQAILARRDPGERLAGLRANDAPQARFLWAIQREVFHYAAVHLAQVADSARDLDLAMRWGFGWERGPFETWQAAGWRGVADWVRADIEAGETLAPVPLPEWVASVEAVHEPRGSFSPAQGRHQPRSALPVYRRQILPDRVLGEAELEPGPALFETEGARLWDSGDGVAVLSLQSKMHTLGSEVLDAIREAAAWAARDHRALVIWHEAPFSAGADLKQMLPVLASGDGAALGGAIERFQRTTAALRYAPVPVVAAVQGLALGGGCEVLLHCDRVVAALESYVGLVEAGVGLLPAGGGCKELARRAGQRPSAAEQAACIERWFQTVAMAKVAKSAEQARELGFLREADPIAFNSRELLHVARAQAIALAESAYRPPLARPIPVAGRTTLANLKMMLVNMLEGGFISEHDHLIGSRIAEVLCGGDLEPGSEVDEAWLLALERDGFVALAATGKTQARIRHTLETGKPLRN